jgi:hypothetical protein
MASGSANRQRTKQCLVRFTEEEFAEITDKADRAGRPAAAFLRAAALGSPGPRAQRRPPADHKALRQLLGECGRIGNNINQIARHLNTGGPINIPELREALTAYRVIRSAILRALGMDTIGEESPEGAAPHDY